MSLIATLDQAIDRADRSAVATGNAARNSLRTGKAREAQFATAAEAKLRAEALHQAKAEAVELIEAATYIAFAMRDGAVFARDYAAQRLAAAAARAGGAA